MDSDRDRQLQILIVSAQRGDRDAYGKFLSEVSMLIRTYLSRRIKSPDEVEDVLQEVLISVHRVRHTYIPGRAVGPWIYAIADRRLSDFYRRARRIDRAEVPFSSDAAEPTGRPMHQDPRGEAIRQALGRLPNAQRRVIEMMKIEELSVSEVATQMGMSESSVKVTAFRGYEAIRRILGVNRESEPTN